MSDVSSEFVSVSRGNGVAVISVQRPQNGLLDSTMRAALLGALEEARDDPEVQALVLTSEPNGLSLAYPPSERLGRASNPRLEEVTEAIGAFPKPVVAALRGRVAGPGVELALAARARLVQSNTRLSLPSFSDASLPTPRAFYSLAGRLGPKTAIALLSSVSNVLVSRPEIASLLDETVAGNAVGRAAELGRSLARSAAPNMPAFDDPLAYQDALQTAKAQIVSRNDTPELEAALECLEAALLLPPVAALPFIKERRDGLHNLPLARNKAYLHACKTALMARPTTEMPQALTIVGTGLQARKLALTALRGGLPVRFLSHNSAPVAEAIDDISRNLKAQAAQGRLSQSALHAQLAHISAAENLDALAGADLVVEAAAKSVSEISELARGIRTAMGEDGLLLLMSGMRNGAARFGHLLGPMTAGAVFHPDIGHGEWVELLIKPSAFSDPSTAAPLQAATTRLGLPAILQRAQDGSVATRLLTAFMVAAEEAIARGGDPRAVDTALPTRLKPFAAQNSEGFRAQAFRLATFFGEDNGAPSLSAALAQAGLGGPGQPSALTEDGSELTSQAAEAIAAWRAQLNLAQDPVSAQTCLGMARATLYSTAAQMLNDGIVAKPWDVDFAAAAALGLRRDVPPPLFGADETGLLATKNQLAALTPLRPSLFAPPSDLDDRIKNGWHYERPGETP